MKKKAVVWWKSRIIWLNMVAAALVTLEAMTGALKDLVPVNIYAVIFIAVPILNAMLKIINGQERMYREKRAEKRKPLPEPKDLNGN